MTVFNRLLATFSFCIFALLLNGCGNTPTKPSSDSGAYDFDLDSIQAFLDDAEGLSEQEKIKRKIAAIDFLNREKETDWAHKLADTINPANVAPAQFSHFMLSRANIALAEGEPFVAQRFLFHKGVDNTLPVASDIIASTIYDLRAQLMFDQAEYLPSFEQRLLLSVRLSPESELEQQLNHDLIWEALAEIPTNTLFQLSKTDRSDLKQGWFSLAAISKSNGANFRQQIVDIEKWQLVWPDHPANSLLPADLQLILQLADQQALNIAVFLPLSGKLESVGIAIREGLMAAYFDDVSHNSITPSMDYVDTHGKDINALYDQAIVKGVELIIGPLSKENVSILASRESLPIPTLALNSADPQTPSDGLANSESNMSLQEDLPTEPAVEQNTESVHENPIIAQNDVQATLFQFSLAVESEARQVAERAWRDGHRRALIIAPASSWGDRGVNAFTESWLSIGGEVVDDKRYKDRRSYSSLIEASVAIDRSKQRKAELQRMLGERLEFEPRRRKDVDFIFMLAYPTQAKQLKPLLAYHYAGNVPVYSTSQIYSDDGTDNLNDLNGVRFSAMPWHFDDELNERRAIRSYGDNLAAFQALYAMGVDAYHIYPRLEQLQIIRQAQFYGSTGKLRVGADNRIEREQTWAEIERGRAVELNNRAEVTRDF